MKQRNGVLGLETAKQVMITFLVLSTIGIAIFLALTSLQTGTTSIIDTATSGFVSVANETDGFANSSGYTLSGYNSSWNSINVTELWSGAGGQYNVSIGLGNISLSSSGVVTNATSTTYTNLSITYVYKYTYSLGRTGAVVNNVSSSIVTFFASTGTIFSILIVVVIILAISIIIWAVGRFGQNAEGVAMGGGNAGTVFNA